MKTPPMILHLLLKDFHRQRRWLALLWGFALLLPFMARSWNGKSDGMTLLAQLCYFLLVFGVLQGAVRLDAPGRTPGFLSTRPVPWAALLAEKAVFIAVFLVAPIWIAKFGTIFMLRVPITFTDFALLLAENAIHLAALLAVVMLLTMFFRSLTRVVLTVMAAGLVYSLAGMLFHFQTVSNNSGAPAQAGLMLANSRTLVFEVALALTAVAVAIFRYRRKGVLQPLAALVAGIALSGYAVPYWPYDLSRHFTDEPQVAAELPSPLRDRLKITLVGGDQFSSMSSSSSNGINHTSFLHGVSVEGLEPPYYVTLADYSAEATLKSGRKIASAYIKGGVDLGDQGNDMPIQTREQTAGFKPYGNAQTNFEVFNYSGEGHKGEDLGGVVVRGTLTLEIRKAVLLKTASFRAGVTVSIPRGFYMLREAGFGSKGAGYTIVRNYVTSTFRGDSGDSGRLAWLVCNHDAGEFLVPTGDIAGSSSTAGSFCNVEVRKQILQRSPTGDDGTNSPPLDADWADKAEIIFFTSEPCGRVSIPYEIKDVDLQKFTARGAAK